MPDERALVLVAVEQMAGPAHIRAVGHALATLGEGSSSEPRSVAAALEHIAELLEAAGLDALGSRLTRDHAGFRRFEPAAALHRLRTLRAV